MDRVYPSTPLTSELERTANNRVPREGLVDIFGVESVKQRTLLSLVNGNDFRILGSREKAREPVANMIQDVCLRSLASSLESICWEPSSFAFLRNVATRLDNFGPETVELGKSHRMHSMEKLVITLMFLHYILVSAVANRVDLGVFPSNNDSRCNIDRK